ncbi:MAG TPA: DUF3800 domain-containing protein [Defluviitaleaceae bacterium]|jgi:hypothetical protein|nr:DUF3800 domain-containing protein [Bacteroidales bacterium]HOA81334.1 DUF3800 domain-containing protein [Defluviitaleaceae bacterium]
MSNENYQLFSDESGYGSEHRFGTIAIVSGKKSNCRTLNSELQRCLDKNKKEELKFSNLSGTSSTKKAIKDFYRLGLEYCSQGKIKIHVIVWDKHDKRHDILGRDDIENMKRMYYHIIKRAMSDWSSVESWEFFPDEFSAINWKNDIVKYLERTNLDKKKNVNPDTLFGVIYNFRFPEFEKCLELESHKYPIVQFADLIAGVTCLSYKSGEKFNIWLSNENNKNSLFPEPIPCDVSKKEEHKFEIMKFFHETCSQFKLGVNFSKDKCFKTFNSKTGISIWLYEPQGDYDKAPTKK